MILKLTYFLCLLILAFSDPCELKVNQKMLVMEQPRLLSKTTHGQKFIIGDLNSPQQNYLYVARVKGTPSEMGQAYGELFQKQIKENVDEFYKYYLGQAQKFLDKYVPTFIAKDITKGIRELAYGLLDLNVLITRKYTNPRYLQEIQGIAKGAKINKKDIERLNIVPQIIKAACTVAGVWGPATLNKQTLHVRSLDWDAANPISKYPVVMIYHPTTKGHNKHANLAWVGFVGVLTGISKHLSIGEKVWYPPTASVKTTRYGNPWTYVLRDVLYDANNITTALSILGNAHRTCSIHLGLGSRDDHSFRMLQYAQKVLNNYNDKNYTHYNESYHPQRPGIAYFDKHVQPSKDQCVGSLLTNKQLYGKWELESLWRILGLSHKTGDTQFAAFDLESQQLLVSYSRSYVQQDKTIIEEAYERSPIFIDLNGLWEDF